MCVEGSRNPNRKLVTLWYTIYTGKGMGSHWFSIKVVPAKRVDAVREVGGRGKCSDTKLLSGKTDKESEATTKCRQMKNIHMK
jgi:hypothetical protein